MNKTILLFLIVKIIFSCSTNNNASSHKDESVDLEKFLTIDKKYISIPIEKLPTGHLLIIASINDIEGKFILDTGAGATVIETKRKDKFQLKTEDSAGKGVGAGGQVNLIKTSLIEFKIGKLETQKLSLYTMNLDHINDAFNSMGVKEVDGVIGADILTTNKGDIDYSEMTLYLKKAKL